MARTLYIASTNPGKLRDFALAAARHNILILPLPGLATIEAPEEDAPTFAGNARKKAIYYSRFLPGEMVLADDSGLEADYLDGGPGVRSARYAADAGFDAAKTADANNNLFLLQQMNGIADKDRGARYRCALAAAQDGAALLTAEGTVEGRILTSPQGSGGFGYDPLFYLPALKRTMAEIDDQARWTHSHRGQAFRTLLELLA
ncbi:MAG TPA: non-canonical purine NTP pyrophosphatase [Acidobacteriaceae bacterium]|nr:non-canonical purine NTP pyrophosphatase [Acidobacteriaceae bacterium]